MPFQIADDGLIQLLKQLHESLRNFPVCPECINRCKIELKISGNSDCGFWRSHRFSACENGERVSRYASSRPGPYEHCGQPFFDIVDQQQMNAFMLKPVIVIETLRVN